MSRVALAAVLLLSLASAASAQSNEQRLRAFVPKRLEGERPDRTPVRKEPEKWTTIRDKAYLWKVSRVALQSRRARMVQRIAIVSDGFQTEREFKERALAMIGSIEKSSAGQTYLLFRSFEFFLVYSASPEQASDKRRAKTIFRSYMATDGEISYLQGDIAAAKTLAAGVIAGRAPDLTVLAVQFAGTENLARYPRSNAQFPHFGSASGGHVLQYDVKSFVHELGHAMFGLGDEYGVDRPDAPVSAGAAAEDSRCFNLTTEQDRAGNCISTKWRLLAGAKPLAGGSTYGRGVWHPYEHCRMNDNQPANAEGDFCLACYHAIRATSEGDTSGLALTWPTTERTPSGRAVATFFFPKDALYPKLMVKRGQPFELQWATLGFVPRKLTFTITAPGVAPIVREVKPKPGFAALSTTHLDFPEGLPALAKGAVYTISVAVDGEANGRVVGVLGHHNLQSD